MLSNALFARAMLLSASAYFVWCDDYVSGYRLMLCGFVLTLFYIEDAKRKRRT